MFCSAGHPGGGMADAEDLKSGRHGRHENAPGAL